MPTDAQRLALKVTSSGRGGVFTRTDAAAHGWSPGAIRAEVASGRWTRLRRSVFAETTLVVAADRTRRTKHRLEVAAAVAVSAQTWASHGSAAVVLRLELLQEPDLAVVQLTRPTPGAARFRQPEGIEIHECKLPPADRTSRDCVRVTAPPRTVVDLARELPLIDGVVVIDSAMRRLGVTPAAIREVLDACGGWPGSLAARAAVDLADPDAESVLESVSRVELVRAGLAPETQCWLVGPDGAAVRVDFLWWEQRTVGEADGLGKYAKFGPSPGLDPLQLEKIRQEQLERWGLEMVRWGWREMRDDPAAIAARVRQGFARSAIRREIRHRNGEPELVQRLAAAPWDLGR